ncbi:MAG: hypothetical protein AB7O38_20165 [Pirellulaceae bacterium]
MGANGSRTGRSGGSIALVLVLLAVQAAANGCAPGRLTEIVEGYVTLDGEPLADVRVIFEPKSQGTRHSNVGSYGVTDAQGRFRLCMSDDDSPGAVVGLHSVIFSDRRVEVDADAGVDQRRAPRSRIPEKYAHQGVTWDVKLGETNEPRFQLTTE